ncbi:programmed cell death protein 2-like protein [Dinothrombium tinctorium]|uniref:Programmed cell death protein 2-like protein n=1 Tax=Dinothrombium tinctorium TaxID=1965070 RepID=A0A443QWE4_9ACAR|nr:programmed cell death protein 2-like protein [Dinothrombium tinctorium]
MVKIDIGFVEKLDETQRFKLKSKYFPSKVGGKPSWLSLDSLPSTEQLKCDLCGNQLIYLLQIYAPFENNSNTFHRTLFVFCCNHSKCAKFFKVCRSQLSRSNRFYDYEPPDYEAEVENVAYDPKPEVFGVKTCAVCGCFSDKLCSGCKSVSYCCKEHQKFDWKNSHRSICGKSESTVDSKKSLLFPEYELIIETEEELETNTNIENEESENQRIDEYLKYIKERKPLCQNENLDSYINCEQSDELFKSFRKKIASNPDQVIRYYSYDRNVESFEPLWVNTEKPSSTPNCSNCGSERALEFQIMPQLLYFVGENSDIDFGILTVYTCKNSCEPKSSAYIEEFIIKQDFKS